MKWTVGAFVLELGHFAEPSRFVLFYVMLQFAREGHETHNADGDGTALHGAFLLFERIASHLNIHMHYTAGQRDCRPGVCCALDTQRICSLYCMCSAVYCTVQYRCSAPVREVRIESYGQYRYSTM